MSAILELFLVFLKIGAVSFGGGWTVVGIIKTEILGRGWLTERGFSELVAIAQVTPGPVALNAATLVGFRLQGFWGALAATLAVVTVPTLSVVCVRSLVERLRKPAIRRLDEALRTGTAALVALTIWSFAPQAVASPLALFFSLAAFAASFTKLNPLWVILGAGGINALLAAFSP